MVPSLLVRSELCVVRLSCSERASPRGVERLTMMDPSGVNTGELGKGVGERYDAGIRRGNTDSRFRLLTTR
jgi:hypothetical protein